MPTILETDRLVLRELDPEDADALAEILSDPIAMVHYPAPFTREKVEGWIGWARASYRDAGFGLWAVVRRSDGRFLGDCGPILQPVEDDVIPEVGYHIVRAEQGHGYATEAAAASRDWVFANTAYARVCSIVAPQNTPSRAVAERVHTRVRPFTWGKTGREMLLYWTDRIDLEVGERRGGSAEIRAPIR